jgi:hypothetical protein
VIRGARLVLLLGGVTGCPEDAVDPFFPEEYAASYMEVRNCRPSGDHDLHNIRILADPASLGPYQERLEPFPDGAVVLKEEYAFEDVTCEDALEQWTVMRKLEAGSSPEMLDWEWQRVEADRRVVEEDPPRCYGCHTGCGVPPDGHDGTCAVP